MQYLLESAICLSLFYAFYWILLRRETFFQWNRVYLLLTPIASFIIPALYIELEKKNVPVTNSSVINLPEVVAQTQAAPLIIQHNLELPAPIPAMQGLTLGELLVNLYKLGAVLLAMVLFMRLFRLIKFVRQCRKKQAGEYTVAVSDHGETPVASFFSVVFWNKQDINEQERLIIEHELVHARQWHSLDVLLMEAMIVWQWFNPLIYLYRRSLQVVHEYIADEYVVRSTQQRYAYASLLAQQYRDRARPYLLNTFHAQLKNRLIMLAKHPSRRSRRAKFALVLPLFAALMLLFSFRLIEKIPLVAPITQAVQQADAYVRHLAEITVTSAAAAPQTLVAAAEPSPYILYWGLIQCKFEHEASGRYVAEAHISPDAFIESLKREPRLWNGTSLEPKLAFQLENQAVRAEYYDDKVYASYRKDLETLVMGFKKGDVIKLNKIPLAGGEFGTVYVYLDGESPSWLPKKHSETYYRTDPANESIKSRYQLNWGEKPKGQPERYFYGVSEFWDLLRQIPEIYDQTTDRYYPADNLIVSLIDSPLEFAQRYNRLGENAVYSWSELYDLFSTKKDKVAPGSTVYLDWRQKNVDSLESVTVVNLDGRIEQLKKGEYNLQTIAIFDLVPDGDPRIGLRISDRHEYTFEWGNFTSRFINRYAVSYPLPESPLREKIIELDQRTTPVNPPLHQVAPLRMYADRKTEIENHLLSVKDILEMIKLTPRLSKEQNLLKEASFYMQYRDRTVKVENGVCPADMVAFMEQHLVPQEIIYLSGFSAPGVDLGAVFVKLEVKADNPKPLLKTTSGKQIANAANQVRIETPVPNPMLDYTRIAFFVPSNCRATLYITNISGIVIWSQKSDYQAGTQTIDLLKSDLKGSAGAYTITLETPFGSAQEQFMVAE
ncbi:MAG: M56 family metallopeptidase [Bacteroidota bacterium]